MMNIRRCAALPKMRFSALSQMSIVISMVAAGFGVAIVPASTRAFMPPKVVFRHIEGSNVTSTLSMIHVYNNQSPAVQLFTRRARDWARSPAASRINVGDQTASSS